MASTYTGNTGIELIGTGEQAGTWGTTSNRNFNMIDTALNGVITKSLDGLSTYTLTTTNGVFTPGESTNGLNKVLRFIDSPSGTVTVTIDPNGMEKLYFVSNETNQSLTFTQGTGTGTDVTVVTNTQAIIYADGLGDNANVREIKPIASAGSIGTSSIADGAVIAEKIAATSIIAAKIADGNVTTVKLADDVITAAKIADDAVGAAAINISGNGTAGQLVTSDGDGSFSYTDSSTLSASVPTMQTFQSSGSFTWNRPSGCKQVKVTVVGGGGGGGGAHQGTTASSATGGGGGGGGCAIKYIDVTSEASVAVTVGAKGNRGSGGNTAGSGGNGGTSSFGSFCSATGGEGGIAQNALDNQQLKTFSGDGGIGSGGDLNMRGGVGGLEAAGGSFLSGAPRVHRSSASQRNGSGANGTLGSGGAGSLVRQAGSSGTTGGYGGVGVVIVEEYY